MQKYLELFKGKIGIIIGLFGIVIYSSSITLLTPVLESISQAFPEQGMTNVQLLLSIPPAMSIPMQFGTGLLAPYIHKKRLVQFSLIMVTLGGVLPLLFTNSFELLVVSAVLIGLGGFNITLSSAITSENFDGAARGTIFGLNGAVQGIAMSVLMTLAGILGAQQWNWVYWMWVPAALCLALVTIFFPLGELEQKLVGKGVGLKGIKGILTPGFIFMCIITILSSMGMFCFINNLPFLVVERQLGDPAMVGGLMSLFSLARVVIGLLFGILIATMAKFTLPFGLFCEGLGMVIMLAAGDAGLLPVAAFIFGIGNGIQVYAGYEYVVETVDPGGFTLALAIFMTMTSVGVSIEPLVVNTLAGGEVASNNFVVGAALFAVAVVAMLIREIFFHKDSRIGKSLKKHDEDEELPEPAAEAAAVEALEA